MVLMSLTLVQNTSAEVEQPLSNKNSVTLCFALLLFLYFVNENDFLQLLQLDDEMQTNATK